MRLPLSFVCPQNAVSRILTPSRSQVGVRICFSVFHCKYGGLTYYRDNKIPV